MKSEELRKKFLEFFEKKGHKIMEPSPLISDDPTTLFTTAGMQQFKRYYMQPKEAPAPCIANIQPCLRTSDIELVGDGSHLTFFEMLGNFSFGYPEISGAYFKEKAISLAWEFLTKGLGIKENQIWAAYFKGEKDIPADKESYEILKKIKGLKEIKGQGFEDNFWSLGTEGSPGGPTVELYVDDVEVWNLVFNEYIYKNGKYEPSKYKGVDTGMGLERMLVVLNGLNDVYETDVFKGLPENIGEEYSRTIADHIRASVMIASEGIVPGKNERESVLRKLIRRSVDYSQMEESDPKWIISAIEAITANLKTQYPNLNQQNIEKVIYEEAKSFGQILTKCENIIKNRSEYSAKDAYNLFQSQGCPIRRYMDYAAMKGVKIIDQDIEQERKKHQEISRAGVDMFKGGLAGTGEQEIKHHTAAHLLHEALRRILGKHVQQKGSNITAERLRFDFSHPDKLTPEQIKQVEDMVNEQIKKDLPVTMEEMPLEEAKKSGALGFFEHKYGDKVKVYSIGDFSKEICGGPHIKKTGEIKNLKIIKEKSSSQGVRRIKAKVG